MGAMEQISLDDARNRKWDIVIAGSSLAAMFFLYGLPRNLSVLVVEKGGFVSHEEQIATPLPYESFKSNSEKPWIARSAFGGNSNCWWGQTPRFLPADFQTKTLYNRAEDWLITYEELEPYYTEVEQVMEIAGGGSEHILPRSQPFPFPPHAPSRSDAILQNTGDLWVPSPSARSNGGSRGLCCANGICHTCPVDAKFTILNARQNFERENVHLLLNHEVRAIRTEAGTAKSVEVLGSDGVSEIKSDLVALGANAIFNAAILLRSGFTAPALGRYLNEQAGHLIEIDAPIQNFYGGTSITGQGYHFYHNADRSQRAAVLIENFNVPAATRAEKNRWTERLTLKLIAEELPSPDNQVSLVDDEVLLRWNGYSQYAQDGINYALTNLADAIPVEVESIKDIGPVATEAHILGTTRMGGTKDTGVVDRELKTHEVSNVLSLGSGVFPSCSPANPTLTLSAMSVFAARSL